MDLALVAPGSSLQNDQKIMPYLFPWLVVGFIAGLVFGSWVSLPAGFWGLPVLLMIVLFVLRPVRRGPRRLVLLMCLFGSLGAFHAQRIVPHTLPRGHLIYHAGTGRLGLEGVVVRAPQVLEDRTRILLGVDLVSKSGRRQKTQGLVLITVGQRGTRFHYGDRIRLRCRLRVPEPAGNPGGFSWKRHLALRGIYVTGFVSDEREILLIRHNQGGRLRQKVECIRRDLSTLIRGEFPPPARDILLALVVGERWAVSRSWKEAFAAMGVAHLLAISGLHLGLIAVVTYFAARWLLLRCPWLVLRVPVEKVAWCLVLPLLLGYAGIAGMGILAGEDLASSSVRRPVLSCFVTNE